ncbi:MAG: glycosyltransferase [Desulfomonilaceae bacterium]|nr:glycosyltransferase [Desulfomonilaceae bacterium]
MNIADCRKALVHHWFLNMTGGEKVCEALCEILDAPDMFTILADPAVLSPELQKSSLTTSFVQKIPGALKYHRYYAWMFPVAVELLDLNAYDLVISSDSNTVKGVITRPETCHICYCHSPMRYAWSMYHEYLKNSGPIRTALTSLVMHYLRLWDYSAAGRVDFFACNSTAVRHRIRAYYRRDAKVIHPPCDIERFQVSCRSQDYYLCAGRLVEYKNVALAVGAFSENGMRLVVAGEGPQKEYLKSIAKNNIEIVGWVSDEELSGLYAGCKALIFPGEEDFGIVPVEAQACGKPVIAYGRGGARDTVIPGKTGLFFTERSPEALKATIAEFESTCDRFDPSAIRDHAERFGRRRFQKEFLEFIQECLDEHDNRFV